MSRSLSVVPLEAEAVIAARILAARGIMFFTSRAVMRLLGVSQKRAGWIVKTMVRLGLAEKWNNNSYVLKIPVEKQVKGDTLGGGKLQVVTIKLHEDLVAVVDAAVSILGLNSRSDLIRRAIVEFLERHGVLKLLAKRREVNTHG